MHKLPAKFAWPPHVFRGVYVVNTRNTGASVKCPAPKHKSKRAQVSGLEAVDVKLACRVKWDVDWWFCCIVVLLQHRLPWHLYLGIVWTFRFAWPRHTPSSTGSPSAHKGASDASPWSWLRSSLPWRLRGPSLCSFPSSPYSHEVQGLRCWNVFHFTVKIGAWSLSKRLLASVTKWPFVHLAHEEGSRASREWPFISDQRTRK